MYPGMVSHAEPYVIQQEPRIALDGMILARAIRDRLLGIVHESTAAARLAEHGLEPARRILLSGPPGCGKTTAAGALALALGLPLYEVSSALFGDHLGETGARLAGVLEAVRSRAGVYLFDEFDALGHARIPGDGGAAIESRRITAALLRGLENVGDRSLVVCATNDPGALDPALLRRFDEAIELGLPGPPERVQVIAGVLGDSLTPEMTMRISQRDFIDKLDGLSHADIVDATCRALKASILDGLPVTTDDILVGARKRRDS